jgi:hypothetical protein
MTPGVYVDEVFAEPAAEFRTGVPVFLGLVRKRDLDRLETKYSLVPLPESGFWLLRLDAPTTSLTRARPASSPPASVAATSFFLSTGLEYGEQVPEEEIKLADEGPDVFTLWADFENVAESLFPLGYLAYAVRGFFENGGLLCYVQIVCYQGAGPGKEQGQDSAAIRAVRAGLKNLEAYDEFDLVCAPDIMWSPQAEADLDKAEVESMQKAILDHCGRQGDRFAILDALPGANTAEVCCQHGRLIGDCQDNASATQDIAFATQDIASTDQYILATDKDIASAAIYYPWVRVPGSPGLPGRFVPPCGHVAGVIARSDLNIGVHKAPANEVLEGVLDLEVNLTDAQQGPLNVQGINCLRIFPGRGIRVWGARTLKSKDPFWRYVNVRRLFITVGRWIERNMADVVFEPQSPGLWARIVRQVSAYLEGLLRQGALKGRTPQEAFYVKCDAELNPPAVRESGMVITEIGLATAVPAEFVVVRLIHGAAGLRIIGPT